MRISDWSSDVCASDLTSLGRRLGNDVIALFLDAGGRETPAPAPAGRGWPNAHAESVRWPHRRRRAKKHAGEHNRIHVRFDTTERRHAAHARRRRLAPARAHGAGQSAPTCTDPARKTPTPPAPGGQHENFPPP